MMAKTTKPWYSYKIKAKLCVPWYDKNKKINKKQIGLDVLFQKNGSG